MHNLALRGPWVHRNTTQTRQAECTAHYNTQDNTPITAALSARNANTTTQFLRKTSSRFVLLGECIEYSRHFHGNSNSAYIANLHAHIFQWVPLSAEKYLKHLQQNNQH